MMASCRRRSLWPTICCNEGKLIEFYYVLRSSDTGRSILPGNSATWCWKWLDICRYLAVYWTLLTTVMECNLHTIQYVKNVSISCVKWVNFKRTKLYYGPVAINSLIRFENRPISYVAFWMAIMYCCSCHVFIKFWFNMYVFCVHASSYTN